jgi:hypothetical protein
MENIAKLDDKLSAIRSRMLKGNGQSDEMLAMFDGITSCLVAIATEVAGVRRQLESQDEA